MNSNVFIKIPESLAVLFDVLSDLVGVSGEKGLECHILVCTWDFDLADDVADRSTDVRLCAPFSTPTACCLVACCETCQWKAAAAVPTFAQLSTIGAHVHSLRMILQYIHRNKSVDAIVDV